MKVASALESFLLAVFCMEAAGRCKPGELELCHSTTICFCKKCISCPKGYGSSHQCGGQYPNGTIITCEPCTRGVNYSDESGISNCQPCTQCIGRETLLKCTPSNKMVICSSKCKRGYKKNSAVNECELDPAAIKPTTKVSSKKSQTTTLQLSSTKFPASVSARDTSSAVIPTKPEKVISEKPSPSKSAGTKHTEKDQKAINSSGSDYKLTMLTVLLILVCILILSLLIHFLSKKMKMWCHAILTTDEEYEDAAIALTEQGQQSNSSSVRSSEESIQDKQVASWPCYGKFQFRDIPTDLADFLAVKISQPNDSKGWRKIGEELGVKEIDLDRINIHNIEDGKSKGACLFELLRTSKPRLRLDTVISALIKVDKYNLVEEIRKSHFVPKETMLTLKHVDSENINFV